MLKVKPTAFLRVALLCLLSWPQAAAVLSTLGWRGIGAGSCKCLCSSSTRHTALRWLRPISVATVNCYNETNTITCDNHDNQDNEDNDDDCSIKLLIICTEINSSYSTAMKGYKEISIRKIESKRMVIVTMG